MSEHGLEEGDVCARDGCVGRIELRDTENCSCHISPPCGACTEPNKEQCDTCGWRLIDDEAAFNGFLVGPIKKNGAWTHYRPRPLDPSKIDYRIKSHTNSSQICEGVYPAGTARSEVEARVKGTFGGRFEYFSNGKFKYIAYTD